MMTITGRMLGKVTLFLVVSCAVVLGLAAPAAAAPDPVWQPDDPQWGTAEHVELTDWARAAACEAGDQWTWTAENERIIWWVVPCTDDEAAAGAALWQFPGGELIRDAQVLGGGDEQVWWLPADREVVRRWLVTYPDDRSSLVQVSVTCRIGEPDRCAEQTAPVSTGVAAAMGGSIEGAQYGLSNVLIISMVAPGMFWVLLVLPWRTVLALLRPRYRIEDNPPRVHDLTHAVRRARIRRFIRRAAWVPAVLAALMAMSIAFAEVASTAYFTLVLPALFVSLLAIAYRFAAPHPVEQGRRIRLADTGARGMAGVALTTVAYGLLPILIGLYMLLTTYGQIVPGWPVTTGDELAGRPEPLVGALFGWAVGSGQNLLTFVVLLLFPGLAVLFVLDLFGQRLRAAGVGEMLARDRRPHYLYLRSFDEDSLRMPGLLRRRGLIGALLVLRRVRFEEVLVRQLSMTGPVIAIAPPGAKLPPIGAARASFGNDEWQQHVEHYARTARAVVLSATPREVRAGFSWEIDLVANRLGHDRVMVVLGPWPKAALARRWRQFYQAAAHLPLFTPLAMPWVPAGVHLLAHSRQQGWRAWGARGRTDWTYAMAVDHATREYLPDWS